MSSSSRSCAAVGVTVSPKVSKESVSTSTETCAKMVKDLSVATPAQNGSFTDIKVRSNGSASFDVEQIFHRVTKYEKPNALKKLIQENEGKRVLVFVEKKRFADFLAVLLCEQKMLTSSIHGGRLRRDRQLALKTFTSGQHSILVATKVSLDVKNVDIVVNYDLPKSIDEYVNRIGRVRRVGTRGKAVSFFNADQNPDLVADLAKVLRQTDQPKQEAQQGGGTATNQGITHGDSDVRNFNDASALVSGGQVLDEDCLGRSC